jgi:hypothetical protein
MRGSICPEAWACRLLEKLPMPERVGFKVLPIPTKSQLLPRSQLEALGEQQEHPRIHAGEVSEFRINDSEGGDCCIENQDRVDVR